MENRQIAQSSMWVASQIEDAILEKRIADMAAFGRMMGAEAHHSDYVSMMMPRT